MSAVLELSQLELNKSEVIYGVSWEVYESFVKKYWNQQCPRLTYDSGMMEVEMANSDKHEESNRRLAKLVELILEELELDYRNLGSTTYKKKIIRKGFEPDSCFYIQSLKKIVDKSNIGIENEVPPDLTIEINRTSSSVPRMPVFAAFGVKEVWRFDGKESLRFFVLEDGVYLETADSISLPILSSEKALEFLRDSRKIGSTAWTKSIRNWVKEVK